MFVFIDWYIKLLTAILSWGSFLFFCLAGIALLLVQKRKLLGWCYVGYIVTFLIVRFFYSEFYFRWVPGIAIFLTIICTARSHYEDCVNEKRWWNW